MASSDSRLRCFASARFAASSALRSLPRPSSSLLRCASSLRSRTGDGLAGLSRLLLDASALLVRFALTRFGLARLLLGPLLLGFAPCASPSSARCPVSSSALRFSSSACAFCSSALRFSSRACRLLRSSSSALCPASAFRLALVGLALVPFGRRLRSSRLALLAPRRAVSGASLLAFLGFGEFLARRLRSCSRCCASAASRVRCASGVRARRPGGA